MTRPTRRRLLRAGGGTAAAFVAGCTGGPLGGSSTTPTGTGGSPATATERTPAPGTFRFTSFPDFFNGDVPYPQPGWEDAVSWFLDRMRAEGPAFSLVAGDLADGRWWDGPSQVRHFANVYWGGWLRRLRDHGITPYVAPGDHERGDDPWKEWKLSLVPTFERAFERVFGMPANGPDHKRGLAYYLVTDHALFVSVDTFEVRGDEMHVSVTGRQLEWLDGVLDRHDRPHVVVQGHVPVLPDVRSRHSSGLTLEGGRESAFWQTLADHGVDLYLCGEHHAITATRADGVWQVVHGALWGAHSPVNYLVGAVRPDELRVELKRFPLAYGDGTLWQRNREREFLASRIRVPDRVKEEGPRSAGRLVLGACGDGDCTRAATGVFG